MKFFTDQPILLWVYIAMVAGGTNWFTFPLIMLRLKGLIKELFMPLDPWILRRQSLTLILRHSSHT